MRVLLAALLCASSLAFAEGAPPRKLRIVVDPGHGGTQEGAIGPNGALEKNVALEVSKRIHAVLTERLSAEVLLTREKDSLVHLSDRVAWVNRKKPDLFISIHANSMPTRAQRKRAHGIETFFLSANSTDDAARMTADRENAETLQRVKPDQNDLLGFILADLQRAEAHQDSSRLAYAVHQKLIEKTGAQDRGVQQAPFYVLTGVESPAILIEVGYISHPEESVRLKDKAHQEKVAEAVADGVAAFLKAVSAREVASQAGP